MFLKNKNIIFKIRRSKITDYAALSKNKAHCTQYTTPDECNPLNRAVFHWSLCYPVHLGQNFLLANLRDFFFRFRVEGTK